MHYICRDQLGPTTYKLISIHPSQIDQGTVAKYCRPEAVLAVSPELLDLTRRSATWEAKCFINIYYIYIMHIYIYMYINKNLI